MSLQKTVPLAALALVFAAAVAAGPDRSRNGEERLARMQQHLGLSNQQVSQIREIHANGGGREQVRAVLTGAQIEMMEEHRRSRQGGRRGGPPEQ
jgi:hypothetical protein